MTADSPFVQETQGHVGVFSSTQIEAVSWSAGDCEEVAYVNIRG